MSKKTFTCQKKQFKEEVFQKRLFFSILDIEKKNLAFCSKTLGGVLKKALYVSKGYFRWKLLRRIKYIFSSFWYIEEKFRAFRLTISRRGCHNGIQVVLRNSLGRLLFFLEKCDFCLFLPPWKGFWRFKVLSAGVSKKTSTCPEEHFVKKDDFFQKKSKFFRDARTRKLFFTASCLEFFATVVTNAFCVRGNNLLNINFLKIN